MALSLQTVHLFIEPEHSLHVGEHAEHEKVGFDKSTKNPLLQVHDLLITEAFSAQDVH